MNYSKFSRTFVCKMAMLLAFMFAACSETNSGNNVAGGTVEETGIQASLENISVAGKVSLVPMSEVAGNNHEESTSATLNYRDAFTKMYELDSVTLDTTGKTFVGSFTNGSGEFRFDSVSLSSPYVMLKVYPRYPYTYEVPDEFWETYNENPLSVIVDLRVTNNISVNTLTFFETDRLRELVKAGKTFAEAKQQAGRDILNAFGMYDVPFVFDKGEYENDSVYVMALDIVDYFIDFSDNIGTRHIAKMLAKNGNLDSLDETTRTRFTHWSLSILDELEKDDKRDTSIVLTRKIELVTNFAVLMKRMEKCTDANEGQVVENENHIFYFTCSSGKWVATLKTVESVLGSMTDARDGKTYKTVTFEMENGTRTWMAENLVYNSTNGTYTLSEVLDLDTSIVMVSFDECVAGGGIEDVCDTLIKMGNYFNYERISAAVDSIEAATGTYQGICPEGWRVPTGSDWDELMAFIVETLGIETYWIGDYLLFTDFGDVVDSKSKSGWTYYAVKPDNDYTEDPKASMVMIGSVGKWMVQQRALWSEKINLHVRCIKN
jgi:Fibrobacter succinogenes major domain (Fib_succ_major).